MGKVERTSVLRSVLEQIYGTSDKETALKILTDYLSQSDCAIPSKQRRVMIIYANRCHTIISLQTYVTNSFLFYEGNGVKRAVKRYEYTY